MSKQLFTVAAQLTNVQSKVDKTWKLTFNTQELGSDATKLMDWLMSQGWLVFSPNDDITDQDVPEIEADTDSSYRSPSSRLRAVLYVFWKQKGQPGTWEAFYLKNMDHLIESIKDKLEPTEVE